MEISACDRSNHTIASSCIDDSNGDVVMSDDDVIPFAMDHDEDHEKCISVYSFMFHLMVSDSL